MNIFLRLKEMRSGLGHTGGPEESSREGDFTPAFYPKELKTGTQKNIHGLVTHRPAKTEQPRCPSIDARRTSHGLPTPWTAARPEKGRAWTPASAGEPCPTRGDRRSQTQRQVIRAICVPCPQKAHP